jgi:hypothetical protein
VDYHQTNQKIDTGKTLTRWPVFVDHFTEITGRSIEEVGDKRLQTNIERNGWDKFNPEREDA